MITSYHFLVIFLQMSIIKVAEPTRNTCIFLTDCPVAMEYFEKRRSDPHTIRILQNAHCGFENRGHRREAKVLCENIPKFEEFPTGCVHLEACPEAMRLIKTRKFEPEVIELLRSSACSHATRQDLVRCDKIKSRVNMKSKMEILPKQNECGLHVPSGKITNGVKAELEDFPWIALFRYKNETGHIAHRCHGTLISHRYVITAAHCVKLSSAEKRKIGELETIVLGEYDVTTKTDCVSGFGTEQYCADPLQNFSPESIHIHPDFLSPDEMNDIALIRLNGSATFTDFVKPICLPLDPLNLQIRESLFIGGWGKTEKRVMSNFKMRARIYYLPKSTCAVFNIDHTQICAGSINEGTDTCQGDSGGPLMALRRSEDNEIRSILAGIVSFGGRCGSGYAIYTNVTFFNRWILDTIY